MNIEEPLITAAAEELGPRSQSPSVTRHCGKPFNETDLDYLNNRIEEKPDRSWTSRYTKSEESTPRVTPPVFDPVERYRSDAGAAAIFLHSKTGQFEEHRRTIETAEYWMKEALHYRHLLEGDQGNVKDAVSYWKEQARQMLHMLRDHGVPAVKAQDLRYGIDDADYWKEEAQHLDDIYYGRSKQAPETSQAPDAINEAGNSNSEVRKKQPSVLTSSTKAGIIKSRKQESNRQSQQSQRSLKALMKSLSEQPFARMGAGRWSKPRRPVKNVMSHTVPDQPISSRLRSKG
ncbi:hypothetical protein MMC28_006169 [Mycoblastus sanguinarius]|nr:hypothetical protein [Mycoblastus sanguinarius]